MHLLFRVPPRLIVALAFQLGPDPEAHPVLILRKDIKDKVDRESVSGTSNKFDHYFP